MAETFHLGVNEVKPSDTLEPGQMRSCSGLYYPPGKQTLSVLPNYSIVGFGGDPAYGAAMIPFDDGPDVLLVRESDKLTALDAAEDTATPSAGNIDPPQTSLVGDRLVAAHYRDKWYLALGGEQRGIVLSSSGALPIAARTHGMIPPQEQPTAAAAVAGTVVRPTASGSETDGFSNTARAYDTSLSTFAHATLQAPGTAVLHLGTWANNTGNGRRMKVVFSVYRTRQRGEGGADRNRGDTGSDNPLEARIGVNLYRKTSTSAGAWLRFFSSSYERQVSEREVEIAWGADTASTATYAEFKAEFTYLSGGHAVTVGVNDVRIITGGQSTPFDGTFIYFVSEYIDTEDLESARSPEVSVSTVAASSHVAVLVTRGAQQNDQATHWKIWRTTAGGVASTAGLIATVPIAQTTYLDEFALWPATVQPAPLYPLLYVGSTPYEYLSPAPPLSYIWAHRGTMLGISALDGRTLFSSVRGFPEYWPDIYALPSIPLPVHDTLLAGAEVDGFSIIAATGGMLRVEDVPRIESGRFESGRVTRIAGAPGAVGYKAFCVVPWKGVSSVAWVSYSHGVCITDGATWDQVSLGIDWIERFSGVDLSGTLLVWDDEIHALILSYSTSSTTTNDTYWIGHIGRGSGVLWTGPFTEVELSHVASGRLADGTFKAFAVSAQSTGGVARLRSPDSELDVNWSIGSRRIYGPAWKAWTMLDGRLRHTDFGSGRTATMAWTHGRDAGSEAREHTKTVSLDMSGRRGTQFDISRAAEWHEFILSGTAASGTGEIIDIEAAAIPQGREGKVDAA